MKTENRRKFLLNGLRVTAAAGLTAIGVSSALKATKKNHLWEIDSKKCIGCGRCADSCVKYKSAVIAVNHHTLCPYRDDCPAFFKNNKKTDDLSVLNNICPTQALSRVHVEKDLYEYRVNKEKCIGCGRCVRLCQRSCNGSLVLHIENETCLDCNECAIQPQCPTDAVIRIYDRGENTSV